MATFLGVFLLSIFLLMVFGSATQFRVGGSMGWAVPTDPNAMSYNQWAERYRFMIGDSLLFVYAAKKDSVLQVDEKAYNNCNTSSYITKFSDGSTSFTFNTSGPFFFIAGDISSCRRKQSLVIVVMADHSNRAPAPRRSSTAPSPAPFSDSNSPRPPSPSSSPEAPPPPPTSFSPSPEVPPPPPASSSSSPEVPPPAPASFSPPPEVSPTTPTPASFSPPTSPLIPAEVPAPSSASASSSPSPVSAADVPPPSPPPSNSPPLRNSAALKVATLFKTLVVMFFVL